MKVLVPVDGSQHALAAVRHALRLRSEGLDVRFVLATVQEPVYLYERVLPPDSEVLERISGAAGDKALSAAQALFEAAGVAFEREVGSGEPAPVIVEMARRLGCDAIIVGARGLGALRGALLGPVSTGILNASDLPVTVVKSG